MLITPMENLLIKLFLDNKIAACGSDSELVESDLSLLGVCMIESYRKGEIQFKDIE